MGQPPSVRQANMEWGHVWVASAFILVHTVYIWESLVCFYLFWIQGP